MKKMNFFFIFLLFLIIKKCAYLFKLLKTDLFDQTQL